MIAVTVALHMGNEADVGIELGLGLGIAIVPKVAAAQSFEDVEEESLLEESVESAESAEEKWGIARSSRCSYQRSLLRSDSSLYSSWRAVKPLSLNPAFQVEEVPFYSSPVSNYPRDAIDSWRVPWFAISREQAEMGK